jgi:ATP synthase protein I
MKRMQGVEVGLRLVVAVMLCGGIGFALDRWLGSLPWLMMLGGVLGFVAWIVSVARRRR